VCVDGLVGPSPPVLWGRGPGRPPRWENVIVPGCLGTLLMHEKKGVHFFFQGRSTACVQQPIRGTASSRGARYQANPRYCCSVSSRIAYLPGELSRFPEERELDLDARSKARRRRRRTRDAPRPRRPCPAS